MSSDPAVNAAQRAIDAADRSDTIPGDLPLAAAREALAPLRKLHENWSAVWVGRPPMWDEDGQATRVVTALLDDVAKLVYPAEELR